MIRDLARLLSQDDPTIGIWFGVVDGGVAAGPPKSLSVYINGSTVATSGVTFGKGYGGGATPVNGDQVWGFKIQGKLGPDYIVVDVLA